MGKDLHSSLAAWRKTFPHTLALRWTDGCLQNEYCSLCRYCCGPQGADAPFPMALLPGQINEHTPDDFYLLNPDTAYIGAQGCKSASSSGCRLPFEKRPLACSLFPIVLVNGSLYLYQNCPASILQPLAFFMDMAREAEKALHRLDDDELRHISISLPDNVLIDRYINLHISIF